MPYAAVLLALLAIVLYPAIFMGSRVAPESSLRGTPPWRAQWGPHPQPQPSAIRVARTLAPRLETLARDGFSCALWNPYVGGGRAGWVVSAEEGGTPLTVLAGLAARRGWAFTALLATVMSVAFVAVAFLLRRLGASTWAAVVGAVAYALSGAVSTSLLSPSGSAVALGPLVLAVALSNREPGAAKVGLWALLLAALGWSGTASVPFVVMALALLVLRRHRKLPGDLLVIAVAALLAVALLSPRWWLASVADEPGAAAQGTAVAPPLTTPSALLVTGSDSTRETVSSSEIPAVSSSEAALLGLPVVLLALLGLSRLRRRIDLLWPAFAVSAVWLAFAPAAVVSRLGLSERPFAALALSTAVLAAFGCDRLLAGVASPRLRASIGVVAAFAIASRLLPAAAEQIPFFPIADGELPSPLPAGACADGSRLVGLLDTLPPDVAAALALRDARAADLRREPEYERLLAAGPGGLLPVTGALRPRLADIGVRWVLEPLPLRVVSGEIFAAVELRAASRVASGNGWIEYHTADPGGTVRVGLPSETFAGASLFERRVGRLVRLPEDATLASETSAWSWWSLVPSPTPRDLVIRAARPHLEATERIEVALDRSDISLVGESLGARIWRRDDALDMFTEVPEGGAELQLVEASPQRLAAQVNANRDVTVRALVKYRPGLRHATVDGVAAEIESADRIWSAVRVPAGSHRLVIESRIPVAVRTTFLLALGLVAVAWVIGRRI